MLHMSYLKTGQQCCYDSDGKEIECIASGQDAEFKNGRVWPSPRFVLRGHLVEDQLTGLCWTRKANFADFPLTWQEALDYIQAMNRQQAQGYHDWRLPNLDKPQDKYLYEIMFCQMHRTSFLRY